MGGVSGLTPLARSSRCRNGSFGREGKLRAILEAGIGEHCKRASVLVAEPAADGRDVNARFNALSGKQVPQVVMGEPGNPERLASGVIVP